MAQFYNGESRRLRLVLTSQSLSSKGEKLLLDSNHPVHGSGLLSGYVVVPDGSQLQSWRLLHTVSKGGGTRFTVGSTIRYPPGQAADAANKAKGYQFEALRKIYFYDAWRCQPELNKANSLLHLPPAPGLLQNGCYWRPAEGVSDSTNNSVPQHSTVTVLESSSAEDEAAAQGGNAQPSVLPSPSSANCERDHPVSVRAAERMKAQAPPHRLRNPPVPCPQFPFPHLPPFPCQQFLAPSSCLQLPGSQFPLRRSLSPNHIPPIPSTEFPFPQFCPPQFPADSFLSHQVSFPPP